MKIKCKKHKKLNIRTQKTTRIIGRLIHKKMIEQGFTRNEMVSVANELLGNVIKDIKRGKNED